MPCAPSVTGCRNLTIWAWRHRPSGHPRRDHVERLEYPEDQGETVDLARTARARDQAAWLRCERAEGLDSAREPRSGRMRRW